MKFKPKEFVLEQTSKGKTTEEASFLLGFKSVIESVRDMEEDNVVEKLNEVWNYLESK